MFLGLLGKFWTGLGEVFGGYGGLLFGFWGQDSPKAPKCLSKPVRPRRAFAILEAKLGQVESQNVERSIQNVISLLMGGWIGFRCILVPN